MHQDVVVYLRVSTEEQNPESQLQVILNYARQKRYRIVKVFKENISGAVHPMKRPIFREMLEYCRLTGISVILMYDITRFYRGTGSAFEVLKVLRQLTEKGFIFVFVNEPYIQDPILRELWEFIKSWYGAFERLQISQRTKTGLMRLKREGKLYHRPSLLHYFASVTLGKKLKELTIEDLRTIAPVFLRIVERYLHGEPRVPMTKICQHLELYERPFTLLYRVYPQAGKSRHTMYRAIRLAKKLIAESRKKRKRAD